MSSTWYSGTDRITTREDSELQYTTDEKVWDEVVILGGRRKLCKFLKHQINLEMFQMSLSSWKYSSISNEKRKSLDLLVAPFSSWCIKMRLSVWDYFNTTAITTETAVFWWPTFPQHHLRNYLPDVPSLPALVSLMKKIPPDSVPQWSANLDPQSSRIFFW